VNLWRFSGCDSKQREPFADGLVWLLGQSRMATVQWDFLLSQHG